MKPQLYVCKNEFLERLCVNKKKSNKIRTNLLIKIIKFLIKNKMETEYLTNFS